MKKLSVLFYFFVFIFKATAQQAMYDVIPGDGNGLRFWSDDKYKIHMGATPEYKYGPVTDYSIKMNMDVSAGRGWSWGIAGQTPIAALNNQGHMQIAGNMNIGGTFTANSFSTMSLLAGEGNGIKFWGSDSYKIHMGSTAEYLYGPVTGYSIKSNMHQSPGYGWSWGIAGQPPIAALGNQGHMQIAGNMNVGGTFTANNFSTMSLLAGEGNGIKFWGSDSYKIHMGSTAEYLYGSVTGYSIKSNMHQSPGYGWSWGVAGQPPIAALGNQGNMQIAGTFTSNSINTTSLVVNGVSITGGGGSQWITNGTAIGYSTGNVGIGTSSPAETLDVNGTARISSITQNNALNQILATDASGKLFWRDATSLVSGDNLGNHIATQSILPNVTNTHSLGSISNSYKTLFLSQDLSFNATLSFKINNEKAGGIDTGSSNTFFGYQSLNLNTSGNQNTAIGFRALYSNTTGYQNTANGSGALFSNTTGYQNTSFGSNALIYNTTGYYNNAVGYQALFSNINGTLNTAVGRRALYTNSSGQYNIAIGEASMYRNVSGNGNVGVGLNALFQNEIGYGNTALGTNSGPGSNLKSLDNTTALGNYATTTASNQVRIGNSSVTSIGGQVSWSTLSDGRFKKDLKEDVSGLDFINLLRPVSYTIDKNKFDTFLGIPDSLRQNNPSARTEAIRQTGFVAQEVEEVIKKTGYIFHGVEAPKNENDHYGIRYAEFVVPLTKAVQELSAQVTKQQKTIDALKKVIQQKDSKELDALDELEVFQNNPNPFQQDTEIRMNIPKSIQNATLFIYDLNGKQIDKQAVSGRGQVVAKVEGGHLSPGIYLYTLVADGQAAATKRMILTD
jgi:trimeric autotransporter adhesin